MGLSSRLPPATGQRVELGGGEFIFKAQQDRPDTAAPPFSKGEASVRRTLNALLSWNRRYFLEPTIEEGRRPTLDLYRALETRRSCFDALFRAVAPFHSRTKAGMQLRTPAPTFCTLPLPPRPRYERPVFGYAVPRGSKIPRQPTTLNGPGLGGRTAQKRGQASPAASPATLFAEYPVTDVLVSDNLGLPCRGGTTARFRGGDRRSHSLRKTRSSARLAITTIRSALVWMAASTSSPTALCSQECSEPRRPTDARWQ